MSTPSDLDLDTNLAENSHHWQVEASVSAALPIHPTNLHQPGIQPEPEPLAVSKKRYLHL
ncbi:hypothetical protein SERLA73DRAFT_70109 [Serpula lacrymans var. lacrymans S7.3]|uniref:Uncharacterized protein n=2 Tax=Serpula lacrymans var. lacrymans TaxID=341189 RepID=F8PLX5_SERL3|nr:uncharacterized protein SERLADRAFT_434222 [Serpula lacrymans var. lacrymans S7.9]EGO02607.1 hypothetical protein SERLA73DRAFT_70109 [Serpula lacrymans var. lacrymans S7.3]EGO28318.1 hypothetical protein SERLADRAFT_434222 [Serpula lacrymans var. lacrymans S7.9]